MPRVTHLGLKLFELFEDTLTLDTLETVFFYPSFPLFTCDVLNACHSNHGNTSVMSLSYVVLHVRSLSKQQVIEGCRGDLLPPCPARRQEFVVMDEEGGCHQLHLKVCYLFICLRCLCFSALLILKLRPPWKWVNPECWSSLCVCYFDARFHSWKTFFYACHLNLKQKLFVLSWGNIS